MCTNHRLICAGDICTNQRINDWTDEIASTKNKCNLFLICYHSHIVWSWSSVHIASYVSHISLGHVNFVLFDITSDRHFDKSAIFFLLFVTFTMTDCVRHLVEVAILILLYSLSCSHVRHFFKVSMLISSRQIKGVDQCWLSVGPTS